jgi:hypothetical protein
MWEGGPGSGSFYSKVDDPINPFENLPYSDRITPSQAAAAPDEVGSGEGVIENPIRETSLPHLKNIKGPIKGARLGFSAIVAHATSSPHSP